VEAFTNVTESCMDVGGLKNEEEYFAEIKFKYSDGSEVVKTLTWKQPGRDMISWYLFPGIPLHKVDSTNSFVLMTRDFKLTHVKQWDGVYIGSKPASSGGWKMRGVRLEVEGGGKTNIVTSYCHIGENVINITEQVPCDMNSKVRVVLRYDGKGVIGIDKPLCFCQWDPTIAMGFDLE